MMDFNRISKVVITCKDRAVSYLEQEVIALGFTPAFTTRTTVELDGSLNDCIFLNMHLRTASMVLFELKSFPLRNVRELYDMINVLPWEQCISSDTYFSVASTVNHESVDNPLFVNVKIKDAIVDRFREITGERPNSGSDFEGAVIQLFWKNEEANVYLNTTGKTLAKHGYRKIPGLAPMMEDLAASTILATEWDLKSPFVNPMCGAGTVAIEAAMLASNRYPGLYRDQYAFQHIKGYDPVYYDRLKKELEAKIQDPEELIIIASDLSVDALKDTKKNAQFAGVDHLIQLEHCDFADTTIPESDNGILFINPEYGERLGELEALEETYDRIGNFMKQKCAGYTGFIFTGNLELAKKVRLKTSRRIEFYNGTIDCRLLKYELYKGTRVVKE